MTHKSWPATAAVATLRDGITMPSLVAGEPMTTAAPVSAAYDDSLVALIEPIRRVAAARGADHHTVDDVAQETLARVMAQRERLDEDALLPYALVTARNLVASAGRDASRGRRHAHRLVDLREPERPEDVALRREEEQALTAALGRLSPAERDVLVRHEVGGEDTAALAGYTDATAGGVAARLARTRAKLRVDFLLQLRRVQLPSARCRPVLLALSAGDRRRQASLGAGRHLLTCATCTELSEPLLERRRALAGLVPWLLPGAVLGALRRLPPSRTTQATVATVTVAAVAGAVVVATPTAVSETSGLRVSPPRPFSVGTATARPGRGSAQPGRGVAPAPVWTLAVGGHELLPLGAGGLAPYAGQSVTAIDVPVQSVDADEGFWIGSGPANRVWVQLTVPGGGESPQQVRVGQRVSFRGIVARNPVGFAAAEGISPTEGAAQLTGQGGHLAVPTAQVSLR